MKTLFPELEPKTQKSESAEGWEKEWEGMPEFIQEAKEPYAKIIFRFENEEDLKKFSEIIGQKLTRKTKSAWFPFKSHWGQIKKIWVDEP